MMIGRVSTGVKVTRLFVLRMRDVVYRFECYSAADLISLVYRHEAVFFLLITFVGSFLDSSLCVLSVLALSRSGSFDLIK
jgi:hypothetical protein